MKPLRKVASIVTEPHGPGLWHHIELECGHITERATHGKWRPRGLRCGECAPTPRAYTAADLARVRRETLEEAARTAEAYLHHPKTAEESEAAMYSNGTVERIAHALRSLASTPEAP